MVQVMFVLRFAAGALLAMPRPVDSDLVAIAGAAVVWWSAVVAVYLFNGLMDATEDRVNGSRRPIASGIVDPDTARRWVAVFTVVTVAGAALLGGGILLCALLLLACGYAYSGPPFFFKRRPLLATTVALAGGLVTYAAGYIASHPSGSARGSGSLILLAVAMSMWMGLIGCITKDFSDTDGDAAAKRRTLTLLLGTRRANRVVSLLALTLGLLFLTAAQEWARALVPAAVLTCLGAGILAAVALSGLSHGGGRDRLRRPYRVFMTTQYCAHVAVIAAVLC